MQTIFPQYKLKPMKESAVGGLRELISGYNQSLNSAHASHATSKRVEPKMSCLENPILQKGSENQSFLVKDIKFSKPQQMVNSVAVKSRLIGLEH